MASNLIKLANKLGIVVSGMTASFVSTAVITGNYIPVAQAEVIYSKYFGIYDAYRLVYHLLSTAGWMGADTSLTVTSAEGSGISLTLISAKYKK